MIRIIFEDGQLIECTHIDRIYVDENDKEKINIVGNISPIYRHDYEHITMCDKEGK